MIDKVVAVLLLSLSTLVIYKAVVDFNTDPVVECQQLIKEKMK